MMSHAESKRLLFIHIRDDEVGFFVFQRFYYIALAFFMARKETRTWKEFWDSLDSDCREFIAIFMECDEITPMDDSKISELDGMWIFDDHEFPMTQFADETYDEIKSYLPLELITRELRTEYGKHIGLFPLKHFDLMQKHLDKVGFKTDKVASLVTVDIRDY